MIDLTFKRMRQGSAADADYIISFFGKVGAGIFHLILVLFLVSVQARNSRMC